METSQLVLIVGYFSTVFAIVIGFLFYWLKKNKTADVAPAPPAARAGRGNVAAAAPEPAAQPEAPQGRRGRGGLDRMRVAAPAAPQVVEQPVADVEDGEPVDGEDDDRKLSKEDRKRLEKERKKQEREAERQAEAAAREARDQKKQSKSEAQRKKDEERERKQKEREEAEAKAAEEKRKKEEEEYNEWKDAISVDDAGSVEELTEAESQSLLEQFVDHIKTKKVVILDELAADFNLRTQDVVDRIKSLEASGTISGVMDDRGKFIFISSEEMQSVADFIKKRGRVSITEIVAESNKLIRLQ